MSTQLTEHDIIDYIKNNPVMVLGTVGKHGKPHGAAVYVCSITADEVYFITKTETQKFKDILDNPQVSVTIVNSTENSSLQASGVAKVVSDPAVIELVMGKMAKVYGASADWLPPITKLRAGPYQVVHITLEHARLARFQHVKPGSSTIYKELK